MDTLLSLVAHQHQLHPQRPAILDVHGATITYHDLRVRVTGIARELTALGVRREDRVAIVLPNGPDAALSFLGVAAVAAAAPLNPSYSRDEFAFYLGDLQAKLAIVDAQAAPAAVAAAAKLGIRVVPFPLPVGPDLASGPSAHGESARTHGLPCSGRGSRGPALQDPTPDDIALVLHTSARLRGRRLCR